MKKIIIAQCAGMISMLTFQNGFLIAYLNKFSISSSWILILLSIPQTASFLLVLPFAFLSDQYGKKKIGYIGLWSTVGGYILLMLGSFNPIENLSSLLICGSGITLYGIGFALFFSNWFALLKPIVPSEIRGRFFGVLRGSWQLVAIFFTGAITLVLKKSDSILVYQVILGIIVALLIVRVVFYMQIPEIKTQDVLRESFLKSLKFVINIPNYLPFCCYLFLLLLFVGACPAIFNLMQKEYFGYSDDQIVLMGILLATGSLVGYYFGGKMVDNFGTRPVFLVSHFLFFIVLLLILSRDLIPLPLIVTMGGLTGLYGFSLACSSIAATTEMFFLIPQEHISLSTAMNFSMTAGGISLSNILSGKLLDLGVLNKHWFLFNNPMNEFDTVLLICGVMVILLVLTLGLIPSVRGQARYFPSG